MIWWYDAQCITYLLWWELLPDENSICVEEQNSLVVQGSVAGLGLVSLAVGQVEEEEEQAAGHDAADQQPLLPAATSLTKHSAH